MRDAARALLRIGLVCASIAGSLVADSPPEAPREYTLRSANRRFFAVSRPEGRTTTVYEARASGHRKLWEMEGYFPVASLSDDGRYLVVVYAGGNLLPLDHRPDERMLSFYDRGLLLRSVRLDELVPDPTRLGRTDSHFLWAISFGFEKGHRYRIAMADGRTLTFDAATGQVEPVKPAPPPRTPPGPPRSS